MPSGKRMKALISADAHPLRRARGDAGGDGRHHRAARDRGGARRRARTASSAFMDFAPLAAHLRDAEGRYLMFNRRMEELIGVPAEEALGRMPSEIRSPDVVGNSDRHHRLVVETGKLHASEQYLDLPPRRSALDHGDPLPGVRRRRQGGGGRHLRGRHHRAQGGRGGAAGLRGAAERDQRRQPGADEHRPALATASSSSSTSPIVRLYGLEGVDLDSFDRDVALPRPGGARLALRRAGGGARGDRPRADAAAHRRAARCRCR